MDDFKSYPQTPKQFANYTFIYPCVSVGNVAQLTVDLLIATLNMTPVTHIYDTAVLPLVGNDPFTTEAPSNKCQLSSALQLYVSKEHKIIVLQQRTPFVKGRRHHFVKHLVDWCVLQAFSEVLILTTSFAQYRTDHQLTGTQFRYLQNDKVKESMDTLGWVQLEQHTLAGGDINNQIMPEYCMIGSGVAKLLFSRCSAAVLPCSMLLFFCSEGDNAADAFNMATQLNQRLRCAEKKDEDMWKVPSSWRLFYGNQCDQGLFS